MRIAYNRLILVTLGFALIVSSMFAQALANEIEAAHGEAITVQSDLSSVSEEILNLHCFEENLKSKIELQIDMKSRSVISPQNIEWLEMNEIGSNQKQRIILLKRKEKDINGLDIFIELRSSSNMSECVHEYNDGWCNLYKCYPYKDVLF